MRGRWRSDGGGEEFRARGERTMSKRAVHYCDTVRRSGPETLKLGGESRDLISSVDALFQMVPQASIR